MRLKIKRFLPPFPIAVKLTIIYAVILGAILLITGLLTLGGLRYYIGTQAEKDLDTGRANVIRYLAAGGSLEELLEQDLLPAGVALQVFDEKGNPVLDSAPFLRRSEHERPLGQDLLSKRRGDNHRPHFEDSSLYYQQTVVSGNRSYTLRFTRPLTAEAHFLHTLSASLLVTGLIGLAIAVFAGLYLSRKILRPVRDMTETARHIAVDNLEQRLLVSNTGDELAELATTFNHMLDRIQTGFEQQRRFVGDASHELRTPITVIGGYADMLDRWGKQDEATLKEGLAAIKTETANMHSLIEKLLFLARADQGKQVISKTPLAMERLIEEIVRETKLIASDHNIELTVNEPAVVQADGALIKQMLRIFIENSEKYTPPGGTIRIAAEKRGSELCITVADNGIGIPAEDQDKIFERFYRVDRSRTKATGGTGLGLSIARWIAEQHNGVIEVASAAGQGTTITVLLPLG